MTYFMSIDTVNGIHLFTGSGMSEQMALDVIKEFLRTDMGYGNHIKIELAKEDPKDANV